MKKRIPLFIILCILVGCTVNPVQLAEARVKAYIESLGERDIATQLDVLSQFDLDADYYKQHFLDYIESSEVLGIEPAYEDDYIIIMRGEFKLRFKPDYAGSDRLVAGDNRVIRYFTFYKMEDMALKEILDKLIK